ncbi:MAG: hypothetical protein U0797_02015 [Gemmataceae bacterium]
MPVLIYPSPVAADRYIVLNSGHLPRRGFQGTNALLYPRLGDHAVLKLVGSKDEPLAVEVADARPVRRRLAARLVGQAASLSLPHQDKLAACPTTNAR